MLLLCFSGMVWFSDAVEIMLLSHLGPAVRAVSSTWVRDACMTQEGNDFNRRARCMAQGSAPYIARGPANALLHDAHAPLIRPPNHDSHRSSPFSSRFRLAVNGASAATR